MICGRCYKTVDATIRAEWKRRRAAHQAFLRRWRAKTKPSPYRLPMANRRAALALRLDANAGFRMAVQDARIKRAMEG